MKLKIGLVTGEYPPMQGGVGAFTMRLAMALSAAGHEVHIATDRRARTNNRRRNWWDPRDPVDIGYAQLHADIGRWWWPAVGQIADIASRFDLDIINLQYQAAAFDMRVPAINLLPWRLRGMVKSVVTFHDLRVPYLFPKAGRLRKTMVYRLARAADGIIASNQDDYEVLVDVRRDARRVRRIPIGSNIEARATSLAGVAEVRRRLGLKVSDCLVGYFGFLNASKGADTLVRAVGQLDSATHLLFIGGQVGSSDSENNERFQAQVEALIRELDFADRAHWSGFIDESEVSAMLHASDIMVLPYRDGVSLRRGTLMAVLAHGRPLISTIPDKEVTELVHGQNVWLTPVDDPEALREAIVTLSAAPRLRERLRAGALRTSELFAWNTIAEQTAEFYQEIIALEDN